MREKTQDLWEANVVCITTNGFVKANGECVMGRGCAKQAATRYPELPAQLGSLIRKYGNRVFNLSIKSDGKRILSFPVKPVSVVFNGKNAVKHMRSRFRMGDTVPGWAAVADLAIIEESAKQLLALANKLNLDEVFLPRPGCGAGELSWTAVKPVLEKYLDDRFVVVHQDRERKPVEKVWFSCPTCGLKLKILQWDDLTTSSGCCPCCGDKKYVIIPAESV